MVGVLRLLPSLKLARPLYLLWHPSAPPISRDLSGRTPPGSLLRTSSGRRTCIPLVTALVLTPEVLLALNLAATLAKVLVQVLLPPSAAAPGKLLSINKLVAKLTKALLHLPLSKERRPERWLTQFGPEFILMHITTILHLEFADIFNDIGISF